MGGVITATTYRKAETQTELIERFARIMSERYGATLYLFGSRALGTARSDSDYDVVAVSEQFHGQRKTSRTVDRLYLWLEAGGWGRGLDLHCFSPEEFERQVAEGDGFLGQAWREGQLKAISLPADADHAAPNAPGQTPPVRRGSNQRTLAVGRGRS